jgi:hypothetical protein
MKSEINFEISFDQSKNYVLTRFNGSIHYEEILAIFDRIVKSTEHKTGMGRIWDFTYADLKNINYDAAWILSNYSGEFPNVIYDAKVAFVSENKLNHQYAKLFKLLALKKQSEIGVFELLQEAVDWISQTG